MIAGPRTVQRSSRAPASITTRPSQRESTSSPSTRSTSVSRTRRLASSMSSRRPVSFHQPRTMCGSTRSPRSTRCWIASVISSSPRELGRMARAASWIADVNMYTPTSARSVFGSGGFSASETTRPSLSSATPKCCGSGTGVSRIRAVGRAAAERVDEPADPALQEVVAEIHDEGRVAEERLGRQHRVGQTGRLVLDDVGQPHPEPRAVARRRADLVARLRRDDDPDLLDARHRPSPGCRRTTPAGSPPAPTAWRSYA